MNITLTLQRGTILMNALTAVKPTPAPLAQQYLALPPSAQSPRLLELTFSATPPPSSRSRSGRCRRWSTNLSYASRWARSSTICAATSCSLLIKTLLDRAEGALLINGEGIDNVSQAEEMVKLATAVAHLIGRSNFDAMSGQYYARFVVKNVDNQTATCASRTG
jgi:protein CsiD